MQTIRWTVSVLLAAFAVFVDGANVVGWIVARRSGRAFSMVPFAGAISGLASLLVCPWSLSAYFLPVPILADPGVTFSIAGIVTRAHK